MRGRKLILDRVIEETRRKDPVFEIITTANYRPEETASNYIAAFEDLGIDAGHMYVEERTQASSSEFLRRLERCDGVFFSGGNQLKLTTYLGGTGFLDLLKERYYADKNFVIAGTSAGAAAMSSTMIVSGSGQDALIKGKLHLTNGLDFIENVFIDTHFTERGRFGRLIQTVTGNPSVLGLGLGEDTGAVIYNGDELEVIGSGLAVIVDGLDISYTDLTDVRDGDPISVEGIKLHVLAREKVFYLDERRLRK